MLSPLPNRDWTPEAAAHLLNRAAFGGSPEEIEYLYKLGHEAAVRHLLEAGEDEDLFPAPELIPMKVCRDQTESMTTIDPMERKKMVGEMMRKQEFAMRNWWIERMANSSFPAREKCVLFWHGHWATSIQKVQDPFLLLQQNQTLRARALGSFGLMAKDISKDPAMIWYLDLNSSRNTHPNENFARELMELFTLGEGHYSEQDIREVARAFTGHQFNAKTGEFVYAKKNHDNGTKTIFGKVEAFDGDSVIDLIISKPECAEFLSAKLWNFYAGSKPAPALNEVLASEYRASEMNTGDFLKRIFLSREFYAPQYRRNQVKSPVQWLVQTCKNLNRPLPEGKTVQSMLAQLGQILFGPPNVKGWDGGRAWISSSTLLLRYNLGGSLVREGGPDAPDMDQLLPAGISHDQTCDLLAWRFFQAPLDPALRQKTLHLLEQSKTSPAARRDIVHLLVSTPEFQLT